ncbi:hypothetical protein CCP3SC1AL1_1730008 [Gammaproteobacteria bacterium]
MEFYFLDEKGNRQGSIEIDLDKTLPLGKGGAGVVYQNPINAHEAIKIYHPHFLSKHANLREKVQAMLLFPPGNEEVSVASQRYVQIAWPRMLLENDQGVFRGYTMPLVEKRRSVLLEQVLQKSERKTAQIREDYRFRIFVARNLAFAVARLHEKNHGVIDLKPPNVLVYRETGFVCLLDCDGYDVRGNSVRYRADLFTPEYLYPKAHIAGLRPDQIDTLEQDRFALAVILFQLMNNGLHPYQGIPKTNTVPPSIAERITKGLYSYGKRKHPEQDPSKKSLHEYFLEETRELFDRAFEPSRGKPTALEWQFHFDALIQELRDCSANPDHHFGKACRSCSKSNVVQKMAPFGELSTPVTNFFQKILRKFFITNLSVKNLSSGAFLFAVVTLIGFLMSLRLVEKQTQEEYFENLIGSLKQLEKEKESWKNEKQFFTQEFEKQRRSFLSSLENLEKEKESLERDNKNFILSAQLLEKQNQLLTSVAERQKVEHEYPKSSVVGASVTSVVPTIPVPEKTQKLPAPKILEKPPEVLILGRYRDHGDGTITDVLNRLRWKRCAEGQTWTGNICRGKATEYNWHNLSNPPGEWHVPSVEEGKTLLYCIESGKRGESLLVTSETVQCTPSTCDLCGNKWTTPTVDNEVFSNSPLWIWTSSTHTKDPENAWIVDFSRGDVGYYGKNSSGAVRLVRFGH